LRTIALAAIVAFGLYAALIQLWSPNVGAGQDQESDNAIAIERFLYEGAVPDAAIVGSSQAQHIPAAALGGSVANLALAAENPLVGLTIIARSGRVPQRIYVEINQIGRPVDQAFIDGFFAEPGYTLKRFIKALRTSFQPINVAISLMRRAARGRDEIYYPKIVDPASHDALIAQERVALAAPPDIALLDRNLAETGRLVAALAARGAEAVFFEMPIEPQLEEAAGPVAIRQAVQAAFRPGHACWYDTSAPAGLPTRDGIHLDSDTAAMFGRNLVQTVCHQPSVATDMIQRR